MDTNRLDIKFHAEVFGLDKQCGHLAKIVMDSTTWHVTNLIVENGLLFKRATVIPIARFEGIMAQAIYLTLNSSELSDYPDFQETVVEKGVPEWQRSLLQIPEPNNSLIGVPEIPVVREKIRTGVADELVILDSGISVSGLEGRIGQLGRIIIAENFQISQFVVTQGRLLPKQIMIPVNLIEKISEYGIHVLATNAEISEFLEYAGVPRE